VANENPIGRIGVELRSEVPGRVDATVAEGRTGHSMQRTNACLRHHARERGMVRDRHHAPGKDPSGV
jgi:hypothetical protein